MQIHQQNFNILSYLDDPIHDISFNLLKYNQQPNQNYNLHHQSDIDFTIDHLNYMNFDGKLPVDQIQQHQNQAIVSTQDNCHVFKRRRLSSCDKQLKNQTKNIPKNYGKALITYMRKKNQKTRALIKKLNLSFEEFNNFLKQQHKQINSISDLRNFWYGNQYSKAIRILSYEFMRKHCLSYIFTGRIKNYLTHIKYRQKIMEGLKNPLTFNNIKDY